MEHPFVTHSELDIKNSETFREVRNVVASIGSENNGKIYDTLADAIAVEEKPANGVRFFVSEKTDKDNAGEYSFQSAEADGVRFENTFLKKQVEASIIEDSKSIFEKNLRYFYPNADRLVRRYTSNENFNDYPEGYSQEYIEEEGLKVDIPSAGTAAIKHFIYDLQNIQENHEVVFSDITIESSLGVGVGIEKENGDWFGYIMTVSGVVRSVTNYSVENIFTSQELNENDTVSFRKVKNILNVVVNSEIIHSINLDDEWNDEKKLKIVQSGFGSYVFSEEVNYNYVKEYIADQIPSEGLTDFYKFNGDDLFTVYSKVVSSKNFIGFRIQKVFNENIFSDQWRLVGAEVYSYNGFEMVPTGEIAIVSGESEMVYKIYNADDFTGGVHGYEKTEKIFFYADGAILDFSNEIPLTPCRMFSYHQESKTYDRVTEIEEAIHHKIVDFKNGSYDVFNRLIWINPALVTLIYHGISCVHKDFGKTISDDYLNTDTFTDLGTGGGGNKLTNEAASMAFYSNGNKSTIIKAEMLYPENLNKICTQFFSDRNLDNKYYREWDANITPDVDDVWEMRMKVVFNLKNNEQ